MSDYVIILHVGTNDAIDYEDYEASEIVKKNTACKRTYLFESTELQSFKTDKKT